MHGINASFRQRQRIGLVMILLCRLLCVDCNDCTAALATRFVYYIDLNCKGSQIQMHNLSINFKRGEVANESSP